MSMADVFGNDSAVDPRMDDVLHPADVTILGVGNVILRDEGFGVRAAEYLITISPSRCRSSMAARSASSSHNT